MTKDELIKEMRQLREKIKALKTVLKEIEDEQDVIHRAIPNMTHPDAPKGRK